MERLVDNLNARRPILISKRGNIPERLTLEAARFMREQALVIRNSNTKQVSSLHYQGHQCPESHRGGGSNSVPLWTIAIDGITMKNQSNENIERKIKQYKAQQRELIDDIQNNQSDQVFVDTLAPELSSASPVMQQQYLDDFLLAIKTFIENYTSFGAYFDEKYDYELLVASSSNQLESLPWVDDFDRYPTGGRCPDLGLWSSNIVYRVTFNSLEISLFKAIVAHQYDENIFQGSIPPNEEVACSVRYMLCNQLAVDIIATKLVRYLNLAGSKIGFINLNKLELDALFNIAIHSEQDEIVKVINKELIHRHVGMDYLVDKTYPISNNAGKSSVASYMELNRYLTPIYQKFSNNKRDVDKLRAMYFSLVQAPLNHYFMYETNEQLRLDIEAFCKKDVFNEYEMALLVIRYHRYKYVLSKKHITDNKTASSSEVHSVSSSENAFNCSINEGSSQPSIQSNFTDDVALEAQVPPKKIAELGNDDSLVHKPSTHLTMHVLNGFLLLLGSAAIAVAFTVLSIPTIGIATITVASIGFVTLALGGFGLFKSCSIDDNKPIANRDSSTGIDFKI